MLLSIVALVTAQAFADGGAAGAPKLVSFPTQDGGLIYGDLYGTGDHAVVLAHGARFDKGSWSKQAMALGNAGFRVLAIDFRGYGQSRGEPNAQPDRDSLYRDVLAAVRYLHETGSATVAVVGASMGGGASARAAVEAKADEINGGLVLLAPVPIDTPEKIKGRKLFITSRGDPGAEHTREQYERAPEPKQLLLLDGSAHAQFLFQTDQGDKLLHEIVAFLSASESEPRHQ